CPAPYSPWHAAAPGSAACRAAGTPHHGSTVGKPETRRVGEHGRAALQGAHTLLGLQKTRGVSESRAIAQAVEDVALVPDTPALVDLGHRIVPAIALPVCIISTHEAIHIRLKPGPGELCLHVPHDGRVLGQLRLGEVE